MKKCYPLNYISAEEWKSVLKPKKAIKIGDPRFKRNLRYSSMNSSNGFMTRLKNTHATNFVMQQESSESLLANPGRNPAFPAITTNISRNSSPQIESPPHIR
jgi:hypothetical protein